MEWATEHTGTPAVVGGIIQLGRCLNPVEREAVEEVAAAHGHLKALTDRHRAVMPRNRRGANILDNRAIEYLHFLREEENQPAYDTVMGYFAEGRPIYDGAELRHQNHLQICVRNPRRITGCFLPQAEAPLSGCGDSLRRTFSLPCTVFPPSNRRSNNKPYCVSKFSTQAHHTIDCLHEIIVPPEI